MEKQKHMTDKMFLIILFTTFAICAFLLIMVGTNVYSHTASAMNDDYEKRIDISYVTETFHGKTALIHKEMINGMRYLTYLYQENGALRELMVREGLDTTTMQGEKIVASKGFEIKQKGSLYDIKICMMNGNTYRTCVYKHSRD